MKPALIDAAEELFAGLGVEGVSIRSINAAAGLSPPAVQYHFGSKDKPVHAVLLRRGRLVTQRLATLLDALGARGRMPTPHALFSVIASAYLDLIECEPVRGLQ